jgi:predicted transcriptional regulator
MLAVLMSMKPEWWEKILDGEKTLEIRKTHPQNERLKWPVTVLVYVSGTGAVQGQFLCPGKYHTEPCKTWKKCHAFRVRIC